MRKRLIDQSLSSLSMLSAGLAGASIVIAGCSAPNIETYAIIVMPLEIQATSLTEVNYDLSKTTLRVIGSLTGTTATSLTQIEFHRSPSCSDSSLGSGTAERLSTVGIDIQVPSIGTSDLYARTNTDSECHFVIQYDPLHLAPSSPAFSSTSPASPSRVSTTPLITGTTSGVTSLVRFYDDASCANQVGTGTALDFRTIGIQLALQSNQTNSIYAKAVEPFGNASPCALLTAYVHTTALPASPVFISLSPASPSKISTTPSVKGTASADSVSVNVYSDPACSALVGTGAKADFEGIGISLNVPTNSVTTLYAKGVDAGGVASVCTHLATYIHDTVAPAAPGFVSTNPASPSSVTIYPKIVGTTAADVANLYFYSDSGCTTQIGSGTRLEFTGAGVTITIAQNATTTIYARATDAAGNTSSCTSLTDFTNDAVAPDAPVFGLTIPASPNNSSTTPMVLGGVTADTADLKFFSDVSCTVEIGSGSASYFGTSGIVVSVAANTNNPIYAISYDAVGNGSPCTFMTYYEHSNLPALSPAYVGTNPPTPSNVSTNPLILGQADSSITSVKLYSNSSCTAGSLLASGTRVNFTSAGLQIGAAANSVTPVYAQVTNSFGNLSACVHLVDYTHTTVKPSAPTFISANPVSPTNTVGPPSIQGTVSPLTSAGSPIPASVIKFYDSSDCVNIMGSGTVTAFTGAGATTSVYDNSVTDLYAQVFDAAGNRSACTFLTSYTQSAVAPGKPVFSSATPGTPSYTRNTSIKGTLTSSASVMPPTTVNLYSDPTCSAAMGSGAVGIFQTVGIPIIAASNSTTTVYGQTSDAIGNVSLCNLLVNFVHSDAGPSGLIASAGASGRVSLIWSSDLNASSYIVKRAPRSGGPYSILSSNVVGSAYVDMDVSNNSTFYYVVASANSSGNSVDSSEVSASVAVVPPVAPTTIIANPGVGSISLTWIGSAQSMSYSVYRSSQAGGPYTKLVGNRPSSSYHDQGLVNDTSYYYAITASNPAGESPLSFEVSAVPRVVPSAPLNLRAASFIAGKAHFSWSAPSYFNQFTVRCGDTSGNHNVVVATSTTTSADWTPFGLNTYNPKYCVVTANWGSAESVDSNEVGLVFNAAPGLSAIAGNTSVTLQLSNPDPYAVDFTIDRATSALGPFTQLVASTGGGTLYIDSGLTNKVTYFYRARAIYPGGIMGYQSATISVAPDAMPGAPTHLVVVPSKTKQPTLAWSAPSDYNGFNVWRATSLGGTYVNVGSASNNSYTETLGSAGIYYYKVTTSWGGADSADSNIVAFRHGITTGLSATPASALINLSWNSLSGATSYQVARSTQSGGPYTVLNAAVAGTVYIDTSVVANVGYYYVVFANFADGTTGQNSNELASMTTSSVKPGGLTVTSAGSSSIGLSWAPVAGATRYFVYSSNVSGGPYSAAGTVVAPAITMTANSLTSFTNYYFVITSEVSGVESAYSNEVSARTVSVPGAPFVTLNSGSVQLDWNSFASASSYTVQRTSDLSSVTPLTTVVSPTTTFTDSTVSNGQLYFYRLRVNYPGGTSTPFSLWTVGVTPGVTPPAPSVPSVTTPSDATSISLIWSGSSSATSYNVKVGTVSGGPYAITTTYTPGVTLTGLTTGTLYYIALSALNGTLESANSVEIAVAPLAPPAAPVAAVTSTQVNLSWSEVTCNGGPATAYRIERSVDENDFVTLTPSVAGTTYTDTTAPNNDSYTYRYLPLCGTGKGAVYSALSNKVTLGVSPLAPTGLIAQATGPMVGLSWVQTPQAVSYSVYRGTAHLGPYSLIGSSTAPSTTYADAPAVGSYYYVVRAVNASGVESSNSNEASIDLGLSAPAGLSATPVSNSISLSWGGVGGTVSYTIRKGVSPSGPFGALSVVASPTTSYSDSSVESGVTYYYVVAANTAGGLASPDSAVASATAVTGANIQVPIELSDAALASNTGSTVFERTRTSLDSQAYDGTVSYLFEAVATNTSGASGTINLVDASNTVVGTLTVPAGTSFPSRIRASFVPNVGLDTYRVGISATASPAEVIVLSAKVLVSQTGASRTRLYIPLLASAAGASGQDAAAPISTTNATSYLELSAASVYVRKSSWLSTIEDYNAWELESLVSSANGAIGTVGLYNVTQNMMIPETEAMFSGASVITASSPFDDGLSGFATANENNEFEVAVKCSSGCATGSVSLYKAGLWVSLKNLDKAEVYLRNSLGHPGGSGSFAIDNARALLDLSKFSNPVVYFQAVANLIGGTSATVQLSSAGSTDSGTGGLSAITGSDLTFNSAAKVWARSAGSVTINSNDRFIPYVNAGASAVQVTDTTVVIRVQR